VFAQGRMQRLEQGWKADSGPVLLPAWRDGLHLGTLTKEASTVRDPAGALTFYLSTEDSTGQLASAVNEDGTIRWQRRLGLLVHGQPLLAAGGANGSPLVVASGKDGSLFAFDPKTPAPQGLTPTNPARVAEGVELAPGQAPLLVRAGDTAYQVLPLKTKETAVAADKKVPVRIRRITWSDGGRKVTLTGTADLQLSGLIQGTPALVGQDLVLPLDNGDLAQVTLGDKADTWKVDSRLSWTASRGHMGWGYVTAVGMDKFLITNGGGGLALRNWQEVLGSYDVGSGRRIVGPALLLPAAQPNEPQRAIVADSGGGVTVVSLSPDPQKKLPVLGRRHDLHGSITAGPFLCSAPEAPLRVGCILNGNTLVLFDPFQVQPSRCDWTAKDDRGVPVDLVGPPQVLQGWLIVADLDGRISALDSGKLQPRGSYRLRATAVSTSTPVPFDNEHLFVPLSDGTIMLLPLEMIGSEEK
jgi:hypothetical protein